MKSQESMNSIIKNIVVYIILFFVGDLFNSILWDVLFRFIKPTYSETYIILRMIGCIIITYSCFWIYTEKCIHMKMKDFGITLDLKKWGVVLAVILPTFVVLVYLLICDTYVTTFPAFQIILMIIASILAALKAGILEEILFRGYIMRLLEIMWGKHVAIIIPSFVFSLFHIPSMDTFSMAGVILLITSGTLVGIMFSLAAYKGNSISNSVLMHTIWNFTMVTSVLHISTKQSAYGEPIISLIIPNDNILLTGAGFGVEASGVAIGGYIIVCLLIKLLYRGSKK